MLADPVDEVILIERDELPQAPAGRAGIPQGCHLHNLLVRGHRELETLFPGFGAAIEAGAAPRLDLIKERAFLSIWGWAPRYSSDLVSRLATRDLFEHAIGERVRQGNGGRCAARVLDTFVQARPAVSFDCQGVVVRNPMPSARLAGVPPTKGGRWIVTLAGFARVCRLWAGPVLRKEDAARKLAERDGIEEGLVCIFSVLKPRRTCSFRFQPAQAYAQSAKRKCLHLYYYFMDRDLGLVPVRVQTWFPLQIQVYCSSHSTTPSCRRWWIESAAGLGPAHPAAR